MSSTIDWKKAYFVKTAILPKDYPKFYHSTGAPIPEIAVAGRSNVGKSSLLNDLFQSKNLVKTSSTPGKTQAINFFAIDHTAVFVDLPGYGYAQVPLEVKKQWGPMVQSYFETTQALRLLLFLLDIRRLPNHEDLQLLEWAAFTKTPVLIIFSKIDKVTDSIREIQTKKNLDSLPYAKPLFLHHSSKTHAGSLSLRKYIMESLQ